MGLVGFAEYLDIKNGGRIAGLSIYDPIAIFSFACLCIIVLLAIFLLTWTARRSAEEIWTSTTIRRPANDYMPAYKRHRRSTLSLNSNGSSAPLLSSSRRESTLSLISHNAFRESASAERDPEMAFSPQAVTSRCLTLPVPSRNANEHGLDLPREPEPVEHKLSLALLRAPTPMAELPAQMV
jgi:hypothetical protein